MRSERFNNIDEVEVLEKAAETEAAGPVLYVRNGEKYIYPGEAHIAVIGRTGTGKSQCGSLPYIRELLEKHESIVAIDPKGELYNKNACYIPESYNVFCLDLREPRKSPTCYNPLLAPYKLYKSSDPDDRDRACSMVSELYAGIYPHTAHVDPFWADSAAQFTKGLTYALFDYAESDAVNLESIALLMEQSEITRGNSILVKSLYNALPTDSIAKRNIAVYATAPNETRLSIASVATSGLEPYARSTGIMQLLGNDNIDVLNIDIEKPTAIFVILPDENSSYDAIAATFVSQLYQQLICEAQKSFADGRLPIRWNFILEELGSLSKALPNLPNMLTAARSRNIRMMLILQAYSQLCDLYGKSNAETITSCIGVTIGFPTNNWDTLQEWSQRCGECEIEHNNGYRVEPLITPVQLAAMKIGTALVMVENRYKFISHIPFFNELYDNSGWKAPKRYEKQDKPINTVNLEQIVDLVRNKNLDSFMRNLNHDVAQKPSQRRQKSALLKKEHDDDGFNIDSIIAGIDARIAELEEEEQRLASEEADNTCVFDDHRYRVGIIAIGTNKRDKVAELLASETDITFKEASEKLSELPVMIPFSSKNDAMRFKRAITAAGAFATLINPQ